MATVSHTFLPSDAVPAASDYPLYDVIAGTYFPVPSLKFDAATDKTCFFFFRAVGYGSGNVTVKVDWYADSASAEDVVFGAAISRLTPNDGTVYTSVEGVNFGTAATTQDTHLGTTNKRLHQLSITVTDLDNDGSQALAAGDWCVLKLYRDADAGADDLTGYANVVMVTVEYSDT